MTGTWLAVCLALVAQDVKTPDEVLAATLGDMRGRAEEQDRPSNSSPAVASFEMAIRLPREKPSGTRISAARLKHKTPVEAKKAYRKAGDLVRAGKTDRAIEDYKRAIAIDPEYVEAHCDLGVLYQSLKRYRESEVAFREAAALAPELTAMHSNLAWSLLGQGEFEQAERSGRRALDVSNGNSSAHLLLGRILAIMPATRAEAVEHLEYAARTMPAAAELLRVLKGK